MQTANPNDLSTHAVPVLAARLSEAELAKWIPISFKEISDPDEVPEPTKGALVRLRSGAYAVLSYGLISKELTIRLAEGANFNSQLESFFDEVPTLVARVIWRLPSVSLPTTVGMSSRPIAELRDVPSRSASAPRFKLAAKAPAGLRKAARASTSSARRPAAALGSRASAKKGSPSRKPTKVTSSSKSGSAGKSRKAESSRAAKAHSRASGNVSKKK